MEKRKEKAMANEEFETNDRMKAILELAKHPMKPGDTFRFRCTQCGECCKYRDDILLNPFDLCRMSLELDEDLPDIIRKYTALFVGNNSKIPLVSLKMRKDTGGCPFLMKDNRCRVQKRKPTVCALYPLGRIAEERKKGPLKISYFLQPVDCGEKDEAHTPQEWLGEFGMKESEEWFTVWQDAVGAVSEKVRDILPKMSDKLAGAMYQLLGSMLYLKYNPNEPLIPQVKGNAELAVKMIEDIRYMLDPETQ